MRSFRWSFHVVVPRTTRSSGAVPHRHGGFWGESDGDFPTYSLMHAARPAGRLDRRYRGAPSHALGWPMRSASDTPGVPAGAGTPGGCGRLPRPPCPSPEPLLALVVGPTGITCPASRVSQRTLPSSLIEPTGGSDCPVRAGAPPPAPQLARAPAAASAPRARAPHGFSGVAGPSRLRSRRALDLRFGGLDG
jgi:hypothetical protein